MTPDLQDYVERHSSRQPLWLEDLWRETNIRLLNGRMCSGPVQGQLLKMLVRMTAPKRVLELGTFSGYSSLWMAMGLTGDARIHTIEADDELEDFILSAYASAPAEIADRITLHIGPALEVMKQFDPGTFDFIFIDASKREYPAYYRSALPLLRSGGYIVADNTLWDGHVTDPAYDRDPQTRGVREFNDIVAADPTVEKVMIPLRDGLTLIRKL